jgi:hypothetical protein
VRRIGVAYHAFTGELNGLTQLGGVNIDHPIHVIIR